MLTALEHAGYCTPSAVGGLNKMKKEMKEWVRQTFPQKADKIIKNSLSERKIE